MKKILSDFKDASNQSHDVTVVHAKAVNNGQIVLRLRCCGDASTDHHHTIHVSAGDTTAIDKSLADAATFVANQHGNMLAAQKHIADHYLEEASSGETGGSSLQRLD